MLAWELKDNRFWTLHSYPNLPKVSSFNSFTSFNFFNSL